VAVPFDYHALLAQTSIFAGLGKRELDQLLALAIKKRYEARAVVLAKGDAALQIFVIARGRVKAITHGGAGRQAALSIMGPGEVFGEVAVFDGEPRSATITAIEPCELLLLGRNDFVAFLERTPKVAIKLIEVLSRRLRRLSERLEDSTFLELDARLAKELLRLAARYGVAAPRGRCIELGLSQQELGDLVGASRESVNKQLRAWEEAGLIARAGGRIVLCDERALAALGDRG
jgi:CRP/FNR family transcriptional regulator, cyclic AMP receptor protein